VRREAEADAAAAASVADAADLPADEDPLEVARKQADADLEAQNPTPPDPVKALTETVTTLQQQLKDQQEAAAKRERDLNGHLGGLKRDLEQVRKEATVATQAAAAAPSPVTQQQIADAAKTPEKWLAFKKEWEGTGVGEAIEEFVASQKPEGAPAAAPADVESLLAERMKTEREANEQRFRQQEALIVELTMNQGRPGWRDTVSSKKFQEWRAAQPPATQELGASPNPQDALKMIAMFDEATAPAAAKAKQNRSRLENAVSHTRTEHPARQILSADDMTPEQLWAYEERMEAAEARRAH